jgi:hypothetical protein
MATSRMTDGGYTKIHAYFSHNGGMHLDQDSVKLATAILSVKYECIFS